MLTITYTYHCGYCDEVWVDRYRHLRGGVLPKPLFCPPDWNMVHDAYVCPKHCVEVVPEVETDVRKETP